MDKGGDKVKMNKKLLGFALASIFLAMLALPISAALAIESTPVSGVYMYAAPPTYEKDKMAGNNEIARGTVLFMWTGDIQGLAYCDLVWNLHPEGNTGRTIHQIGSAAVNVGENTLEGSLTILVSLESQEQGGIWTIIGGTGELKGLHGDGTYTHINQYVSSYSGNVRLDP